MRSRHATTACSSSAIALFTVSNIIVRDQGVRFATDSPVEGDGFKLLVPGLETVKPSSGDRTAVLTTAAELSRNRWFESVFLQRGGDCEPDFRGRILSMTVGPFFFPSCRPGYGFAGSIRDG